MHTWEDCRQIIKSKRLGDFRRSPAQSSTYKQAKQEFQKTHGGTAQFVITERLQWVGDGLKPVSNEFLGDFRDLKVLMNDFPYDWEPGMQHLVVWSKVPIPCGEDELPTPAAAEQIEKFLETHFTNKFGVPREDMLWFKNTLVLQSIPSVSHFHVLLRNRSEKDARAMCGVPTRT